MPHSHFQSFIVSLSISSVCILGFGCSGPRPVLYPNDHLQQVGPDRAEQDIEECKQLAEDYVPEHEASTVAGNTAVGAGAGGAVGAVSGALRGGVGIGAAIGAATGATIGFIRGLFQASQPTPAHQAFVNRCLSERGYDSIGWE
ncbi:cell envelope biogenesis protein OmpA [Nitrospira sp. MA-1]|nr:cell envelope biogenesis protein OmpA [Nitrospira sp. MA-1]